MILSVCLLYKCKSVTDNATGFTLITKTIRIIEMEANQCKLITIPNLGKMVALFR